MALMATHGSVRIACFVRYAESATLLELLLASPFLSRRRGNWWMRLAIDRDHAERLTLPPPPAEPSTLMIGARALRQVRR
jgi:hypothetical protein